MLVQAQGHSYSGAPSTVQPQGRVLLSAATGGGRWVEYRQDLPADAFAGPVLGELSRLRFPGSCRDLRVTPVRMTSEQVFLRLRKDNGGSSAADVLLCGLEHFDLPDSGGESLRSLFGSVVRLLGKDSCENPDVAGVEQFIREFGRV